MTDCVIMCGGRGTRLRSLTADAVAKPLVKIAGRELITYTLDLLSPSFVDTLILAIDHHAQQIRAWSRSADLPYPTRFSFQERPGYLNAVQCAMRESGKDTVLLCHADEIKPGLLLKEALKFHAASGEPATVVATTADHLDRHWVVTTDATGMRVRDLSPCPPAYRRVPEAKGTVLAGAMILNRAALRFFDPLLSADYAGIVRPLMAAGALACFTSPAEALFNISTPQDYDDAVTYLAGVRPGGDRQEPADG